MANNMVLTYLHLLDPEMAIDPSNPWFKGKSKPETMIFTIKYENFRLKFSLKPIQWIVFSPDFRHPRHCQNPNPYAVEILSSKFRPETFSGPSR